MHSERQNPVFPPAYHHLHGSPMDGGRLAPVEPRHLIFSIWALTQHYADFDVQVRAVLGPGHDPFVEAEPFLDNLYRMMLRV